MTPSFNAVRHEIKLIEAARNIISRIAPEEPPIERRIESPIAVQYLFTIKQKKFPKKEFSRRYKRQNEKKKKIKKNGKKKKLQKQPKQPN